MSGAGPGADVHGAARPDGGPGRRRWPAVVAGAAVLVVLAAVGFALFGRPDRGAPPSLSLQNARAGERVGTTVAVYVTLTNEGGADLLVEADAPDASRVLVHGTDEVGIMRTSPELEVPASSTLRLEPGGTHLMLEGVGRDLAVGDTVPVELEFERSGRLRLDAPVVPLESLVEGPAG